jgi:hypothetical protein
LENRARPLQISGHAVAIHASTDFAGAAYNVFSRLDQP